jgi:phage terminase large subunit
LSTLTIPTARVFKPLLGPSRYKGVHGGRGSGKSHFLAGNMVRQAMLKPGFRGVCIREVQKSLKESAKRLIEDKIQAYGLGSLFDVQESVIKTPGDGLIIFQGMQDHTSESIKSLEGFDAAWVEEAQSLSQRSLTLLRPTIRKEGSELWFSWNRTRKVDPVDVLLTQGSPPTDSVVVKANWSDNPWFPSVLEQERLDDLRDRPDQYEHVWEGDYARVTEGAYYAQSLVQAKREGRITRVAFDPLMTIRLFVDIGGTGAKADAFSMWPAQFIGREIRVRDYYEAVGQPLATHINWLRSKGYTPDRAEFWLPHDGAHSEKVYDVSYESAIRQAGYRVTVVPNQGKGAAKARIEAARRRFPLVWFDEVSTEAGRDALGFYHEKKDEARNVGLGPEHDWSSHGSDAFGLMCGAYVEPYQDEAEEWRDEAGRNASTGY